NGPRAERTADHDVDGWKRDHPSLSPPAALRSRVEPRSSAARRRGQRQRARDRISRRCRARHRNVDGDRCVGLGRTPGTRKHPRDFRRADPARGLFQRKSIRMRFTEINLLGVYVAPISAMMAAAWLILIALRRIANRFGLLRFVWHPAL